MSVYFCAATQRKTCEWSGMYAARYREQNIDCPIVLDIKQINDEGYGNG
jgi:hypothetical protein